MRKNRKFTGGKSKGPKMILALTSSQHRHIAAENRAARNPSLRKVLALWRAIGATLLVLFICIDPLWAGAWEVRKPLWEEADEEAYGQFVQRMGESPARTFQDFIRDAERNPLYEPQDKALRVQPDCAELPYFVRAYVASKRGLPFSFNTGIASKGGNPRYADGNQPAGDGSQEDYSSPQEVFDALHSVNSGYYRMNPGTEGSDTYPTFLDPKAVRPGSVYYDSQGHVALVTQVYPDGRVRMVDGHPDHSLTRPWFGQKFTAGAPENGGGFRNWRPLTQDPGEAPKKVANQDLGDYSADDQYQDSFAANGREGLGYHEYVREKLKTDLAPKDPRGEFRKDLQEVMDEIADRKIAVDNAIAKGLAKKPHPGTLPKNIYGATGEWEQYSSPSRDARLKKAFQDLVEKTEKMVGRVDKGDAGYRFSGDGEQAAKDLLRVFQSQAKKPVVSYRNSAGAEVGLSFSDVSQRLADLSFDPYHSPELRWGAKGEERHFATDDEKKMELYEKERRLRNQIERVYDQPTGFDFGPEEPVEFDVEALLQLLQTSYGERNAAKTPVVEPDSSLAGSVRRSPQARFLAGLAALVALFGGWAGFLAWVKRSAEEKEPTDPEAKTPDSSEKGPSIPVTSPRNVKFLQLKKPEVKVEVLLDLDEPAAPAGTNPEAGGAGEEKKTGVKWAFEKVINRRKNGIGPGKWVQTSH